jgi:hypothetical protein
VNSSVVFRCKVNEAQADAVRDRISKAGLDVGYQEEQHGAALVLVVKCTDFEAQTVHDILAGAGVKANDDPLYD